MLKNSDSLKDFWIADKMEAFMCDTFREPIRVKIDWGIDWGGAEGTRISGARLFTHRFDKPIHLNADDILEVTWNITWNS